jgi:hypothetical protein
MLLRVLLYSSAVQHHLVETTFTTIVMTCVTMLLCNGCAGEQAAQQGSWLQ